MSTIPLLPSTGMDNVHADGHAVFQPRPNKNGMDPPERMRAIVDMDIDSDGALETRPGVIPWSAVTDPQRLWVKAGQMFVRDEDSLKLIAADGTATVLVDEALDADAPLVCHEWPTGGDRAWFTDGTLAFSVRDGALAPWGFDPPVLAIDDLADGVTGTLRAGTYLVATTLRSGPLSDMTAQESGALAPVEVELDATGGFVITQEVEDPLATHVAFYISACNGSEPMLSTVVTVTADPVTRDRSAALTVIAEAQVSKSRVPLTTVGARRLPDGVTNLGSLQAFMLAAVDNALFISRPGQPWLWDLGTAVQLFPSPITTIVGLQDGAWIGTEQGLYWMGGDSPASWSRRLVDSAPVLPEGALLPGSAFPKLQTEHMVAMFGTRTGFVLGLPSGQLVHLTQDVYHLPDATRVSIAYSPLDRRFFVAVTEP